MNSHPETNGRKQIVRWFTRPVLPCQQFPAGLAGCLVIHRDGVNDAMYDVVVNSNTWDPHKPHEPVFVRGWRLLGRNRAAKVYDVCFDQGHAGCDCPDGTYHPERPCKHWCALQEALAVIGLPLHGLIRLTSPSYEELQAIAGQLPTHWFPRAEQRPEGTWTIVASYHFDTTLYVRADTAAELVSLVHNAEQERLQQAGAVAAVTPRVPPQRALRYVNIRVPGRRSERFSRAVRGEAERRPGDA